MSRLFRVRYEKIKLIKYLLGTNNVLSRELPLFAIAGGNSRIG